MSEYSRYPSLCFVNDKYYVCINQEYRHNGVSKIFILDNEFNNISSHVIPECDYYITHNFTIFKSKNYDKYFGIGGMIRNQHPFWVITPKGSNETKIKSAKYQNKIIQEKSGIYLLESSDLLTWTRESKPIMTVDNIPNNFIKAPRGKPYYLSSQEKRSKFESRAPEFDSNICCFFSHILNKYILFCRANIMKGCRSIQYTTSDDLVNWTQFNLIKVPTFRRTYKEAWKNRRNNIANTHHHDNYYMFKCCELLDRKIFFALVPFTNDNISPNQHYIKKLMSYNCTDWIDLGCLLNCKMYKDEIHLNTHICEILYHNNKLDIFLFHRCYSPNSKIRKYTFILDETDILNQLTNLTIDKKLYTDVIEFKME